MSQFLGPLAGSAAQRLEPGTVLKIIPHQRRGALQPDYGLWLVFWFENCPDAEALKIGDRVVFEATRTEDRLEAWNVASYCETQSMDSAFMMVRPSVLGPIP